MMVYEETVSNTNTVNHVQENSNIESKKLNNKGHGKILIFFIISTILLTAYVIYDIISDSNDCKKKDAITNNEEIIVEDDTISYSSK